MLLHRVQLIGITMTRSLTAPLNSLLKHLFYLCLTLGSIVVLNGCASDGTGGSNGRFDTPSNREETDERKRAKIRLELAVNYFQQKQGKVALEEVNNALAALSTLIGCSSAIAK